MDVDKQINKIARRTIPIYAWVLLCLIFILIVILFVWSFYGTLNVNILGRGIVLNPKGLFTVQAPLEGTVKKFYVQPGDKINKGYLLAKIYNAPQEKQLIAAQRQIKALTEEVGRLTQQIDNETTAKKNAIKGKIDTLSASVKLTKEQLEFLQPEYEKKIELFKEGLITEEVVQDAKRQIDMAHVQIQEKESDILDATAQLTASHRTEELKNKQLELLKAKQEALVILSKLSLKDVYSNYDGIVLETLARPGSVVKEGQALIHAEFDNGKSQPILYGYFPSEFGKYIQPGNEMQLFLSNINEKQYGGLLSTVNTISAFPISEEALTTKLNNNSLAKFLTNNKPTTEVKAELIPDAHDPSGYRWTSQQGPPYQLYSGDTGRAELTIETIHPIYFLFPKKDLKKK